MGDFNAHQVKTTISYITTFTLFLPVTIGATWCLVCSCRDCSRYCYVYWIYVATVVVDAINRLHLHPASTHFSPANRKLTFFTQDAEYVVSEPQPNNVTQASGNLMIVETAGSAFKVCKNV